MDERNVSTTYDFTHNDPCLLIVTNDPQMRDCWKSADELVIDFPIPGTNWIVVGIHPGKRDQHRSPMQKLRIGDIQAPTA